MAAPEADEGENAAGAVQSQGDLHPDGLDVVDGEHVAQDRRIELQAASFSGPLPPPSALDDYNRLIPGLAREIVEQWKVETAHRHETITSIRKTDHEAMLRYYEGERQGRLFGFLGLIGLVAVAALAIVLDREAIGIASLFAAGGAAIWAIRRDSESKLEPPTQLDDGDSIENV
jgi:uncharacterized membrane protein